MLAFPVLLRLTMTQELTGASLALTKPFTMPILKPAFLAKKEPTTILQLALAFHVRTALTMTLQAKCVFPMKNR